MGLLDEAIREHLELKRRSGAYPSDVAGEEGPPAAADDPSAHETEAHELRAGETRVGAVGAQAQPDLVVGGQETQELDMQAVIDEQDGIDWEAPV